MKVSSDQPNPYKPSAVVAETESQGPSMEKLSWRAGMWLIAGSGLHFAAGNLLAAPTDWRSVEFSAIWLSFLGLFVLYERRVAMGIARMVGTLTLLAIVAVVVLWAIGFDQVGGIRYGKTEIQNPNWFHAALFFGLIGVTFLPPWWWLQRYERERRLEERRQRVFLDEPSDSAPERYC